jgi:feruloyl-CoA synthase
MAQRLPGHGPWRFITYGEAKRASDGAAAWLLARGLGQDDAVLILSGNAIEHALMKLGCYAAGVPAAPISPAYSLMSADHAKLKHCWATVRPKVVFAQSGAQFAPALAVLRALDPEITVVTVDGEGGVPFSEVTERPAGPEVARRWTASATRPSPSTSSPPGPPACRRACPRPTA